MFCMPPLLALGRPSDSWERSDENWGCGDCLADNAAAFGGDGSKTARAWCYSTQRCTALSFGTFDECDDFSVDADTCLCRPDVYRSCGECASLAHLGCVWVPALLTLPRPITPRHSHSACTARARRLQTLRSPAMRRICCLGWACAPP